MGVGRWVGAIGVVGSVNPPTCALGPHRATPLLPVVAPLEPHPLIGDDGHVLHRQHRDQQVQHPGGGLRGGGGGDHPNWSG